MRSLLEDLHVGGILIIREEENTRLPLSKDKLDLFLSELEESWNHEGLNKFLEINSLGVLNAPIDGIRDNFLFKLAEKDNTHLPRDIVLSGASHIIGVNECNLFLEPSVATVRISKVRSSLGPKVGNHKL